MLGRSGIAAALASALLMGVTAMQAQGMPRNISAHTGFANATLYGKRRTRWTNASYRRAAAKKARVKAARKAARGRGR
jgi:hypothetical protein